VTPRRWAGTEEPRTRIDLLDAAARVLAEEGYSAVTSRRVAARAGVNPALVNYYFGSMDDLLVAVFRRGADAYLERLRHALASPQPLRALWGISTEPPGMAEYLALANHHEAIRAEIAAYTTQVRTIQADALASIFRAHDIDTGGFPPWAVMMLIESVSRLLLIDSSLGVTIGHDELTAFVEQYLRRFEPPDGAIRQPALVPCLPGHDSVMGDPAHANRLLIVTGCDGSVSTLAMPGS
jgi:AcrR family transcriptional regulator